MNRNLALPIFLSILALCAPFMFPWPYAVFLSIIVAFVAPPVAAITGLLMDLTYTSHVNIPYFTLLGCGIAVLGAFVHQFVKTRIMS